MKKSRTLVKVMNSGTIGRGNSNLVTEFIVLLRFSLYWHKSAQIENVVRHQRSRRVALDENFSERNTFYCTNRYYPSRDRLITMVLLTDKRINFPK